MVSLTLGLAYRHCPFAFLKPPKRPIAPGGLLYAGAMIARLCNRCGKVRPLHPPKPGVKYSGSISYCRCTP